MKLIILCILVLLTGCSKSKESEVITETPIPTLITHAPINLTEALIEIMPNNNENNENISNDDSNNLDAYDDISFIGIYNEKPERLISYDYNGKSPEYGILDERIYTQKEQEILEGGLIKIENKAELYLDTDNIKDKVKRFKYLTLCNR